MSQQAHFWIRIVGLMVILAAQLAPRLRGAPAPARSATAQEVAAATTVSH